MGFSIQLRRDVQSLVPAYFALVMATGIIGIAAKTMRFETIAAILFYVNNIGFIVLFILYLLRLLFYFNDFKEDLVSDEKGVGYLTIVAASGVLGVQYVLQLFGIKTNPYQMQKQ